MPFAAVGGGLSAIGGIVGSGKQADATKQAAADQEAAANNATDLQKQEFSTVQQNEAPYVAAGTTALGQLQTQLPNLTQSFNPTAAGLPSQFSFDPSMVQNDPAYQFALQQGTQALQRTAAAKGEVLGAATQKQIGAFTTGTADQYYNQDQAQAAQVYQQNYGNAFNTFTANQNNVFNKLASVAAAGQGGVTQVNNAGGQFATNAGNNIIGAGNAAGASAIGVANAQNGGIASTTSAFSSLLNNPSFSQAISSYFNPTQPTQTASNTFNPATGNSYGADGLPIPAPTSTYDGGFSS